MLVARDITFKEIFPVIVGCFNSPKIFYTSSDMQYCGSTYAKFMNMNYFI